MHFVVVDYGDQNRLIQRVTLKGERPYWRTISFLAPVLPTEGSVLPPSGRAGGAHAAASRRSVPWYLTKPMG
jgi:hypothetical protein